MNNTKIEWTDRSWNPVTGCTKVSQGCKNCYAERITERFFGKGAFRNIIFHHDRLTIPLKWKKPSMVFVNSMSDLFHEDVSFVFINAVFSAMSDADQHTYQILTKRPQRMLEFFKWKNYQHGVEWRPKSNVWIGVSVENQETANERIPLLLQVPATIRFLSCEPLLGSIDLSEFIALTDTNAGMGDEHGAEPRGWGYDCWSGGFIGNIDNDSVYAPMSGIHWVIAGGESGSDARPMHPDWVHSIRDQCQFAEIPFFFKQWGTYIPMHDIPAVGGITHLYSPAGDVDGSIPLSIVEKDITFCKVGKKRAGRELDGREWNEMPNQNSQ